MRTVITRSRWQGHVNESLVQKKSFDEPRAIVNDNPEKCSPILYPHDDTTSKGVVNVPKHAHATQRWIPVLRTQDLQKCNREIMDPF